MKKHEFLCALVLALCWKTIDFYVHSASLSHTEHTYAPSLFCPDLNLVHALETPFFFFSSPTSFTVFWRLGFHLHIRIADVFIIPYKQPNDSKICALRMLLTLVILSMLLTLVILSIRYLLELVSFS